MDFSYHCAQASEKLKALEGIVSTLEEWIIQLDDDRQNIELVTGIVRGLLEANHLAEAIRFGHVLFIAEQEKAVADAVDIALNELIRRAYGAQHELEILIKVPGQPIRTRQHRAKYLPMSPELARN